MTKKELLKLANNLKATCIDKLTFDECNYLLKNIIKKDIAISIGTYGTNAYLFQDEKTNNFYYVSTRNNNLFMVL